MASAGLEIKSTDLAHSVYIHFLFLKIKKKSGRSLKSRDSSQYAQCIMPIQTLTVFLEAEISFQI